MKQNSYLSDCIYQYQSQICHFTKMQILSMSVEEKNHYINLINNHTEALIQMLEHQVNVNKDALTMPPTGTPAEPPTGTSGEPQTKTPAEIPTGTSKEFTKSELATYNGSNNKPVYVAIKGIVYDMSSKPVWEGGNHFGLIAGNELTEEFKGCHLGMTEILNGLPKVGILKS